MNRYEYFGPVLLFEKCIQKHWNGCTYAVSEKKAKSNLIYQFKKQNGYSASTKISLPGKLTMIF